MTDFVGVRAAAIELDVSPSTITRYVQQHPNLDHSTSGKPLLDIDELRRHRADNVNSAMSGNHAGAFQDELPVALDADPSEGERRSPEDPKVTLTTARTATATIQAREAQIRLEEKLGNLVDRSEVETTAFEAGNLVMNTLKARNRDLAEELAVMTDPRAIKTKLDAADAQLLDKLTESLSENLDVAETAAA